MDSRIAYIEMTTGIAGDMFVGAMIDAGCPIERLRGGMEDIGLKEMRIEAHRVTRKGLGGTRFEVIEEKIGPGGQASGVRVRSPERKKGQDQTIEIQPETEHSHRRGLKEISQMIVRSSLPESVKSKAGAVFQAIAEVEAHLHNTTVEEIHFHEVGALDSIADVVCACLALHEMGITEVYASEVPLGGGGTVTFSHGIIPVPVPATLELLKGIPTRTSDLKTEIVTPTGAALLRVICSGFGARPDMVVEQVGYGAGKKEFPDRPNLLRILVGRPV